MNMANERFESIFKILRKGHYCRPPSPIPLENMDLDQTHRQCSGADRLLGGHNAVIIAELYVDTAADFPILYLADTVTIPTRYHLHALDIDHRESRPSDRMLNEMHRTARQVVRAGSFLVLGPRLQHWIAADALHDLIDGWVPAVIAFDALKPFDGRSPSSAFDVADNFEEMSKWATRICRIACHLIRWPPLLGRAPGTGAPAHRRLARLQFLLDVANALSAQRSSVDEPTSMWQLNVVFSAF